MGSGFIATNDGLIVTSPAVVEGQGPMMPSLVTVEYALPTGQYGTARGEVGVVDEGTGIAIVKVDPRKVPLAPIPLGDSESLTQGQAVVALSAQREMDISCATGRLTALIKGTDIYSGNKITVGIYDDVKFPRPGDGRASLRFFGPRDRRRRATRRRHRRHVGLWMSRSLLGKPSPSSRPSATSRGSPSVNRRLD